MNGVVRYNGDIIRTDIASEQYVLLIEVIHIVFNSNLSPINDPVYFQLKSNS